MSSETDLWPLPRKITFGVLLTGELLSIPCYLFLFYHFIRDKILRTNLQNHSILILLIYNFLIEIISVTTAIGFNRYGYHHFFNMSLCFLRIFVDYGIWYGALHIMFWISIERHLLIFHSNLVRTKRQRILFHYIPLGLVSFYTPILYFYLTFLYPCQRVYNPYAPFCDLVCYYYDIPQWFNWYESIMNYIFPVLMIAILNIILIVRVLIQRHSLRRAVDWRRHRKMIIQLSLISIIYLACDLPYIIYTFVSWFGVTFSDPSIILRIFVVLSYVPTFLVPYGSLFGLPGLKQKLCAFIFWRRQRRGVVVPFTR